MVFLETCFLIKARWSKELHQPWTDPLSPGFELVQTQSLPEMI